MRLFRKRIHFLKENIKPISLAVESSNTSTSQTRSIDENNFATQPYVEAQTHISSVDWISQDQFSDENHEKPLQVLEPMLAQKIARKYRGTTDFYFVEHDYEQ